MPEPTSDAGPRGAGTGAEDVLAGHTKSTDRVRHDHLTATAHAAEAAVLGAMLLDNEARTGVPGMLTPDDLDRDAHRTAYVAILAVLDDGYVPDVLTVTAKLAEQGQLDTVGGALGVSDLCDMDVCPTPASWAAYATLAAREARRRRGVRLLRGALARLEQGEDPAVVAADLAVAV